MKSGGHELEHWQQASGHAILKRLLVASTVWSLQALDTQEAEEFKQTLAKLSGKSRKRQAVSLAGSIPTGKKNLAFTAVKTKYPQPAAFASQGLCSLNIHTRNFQKRKIRFHSLFDRMNGRAVVEIQHKRSARHGFDWRK